MDYPLDYPVVVHRIIQWIVRWIIRWTVAYPTSTPRLSPTPPASSTPPHTPILHSSLTLPLPTCSASALPPPRGRSERVSQCSAPVTWAPRSTRAPKQESGIKKLYFPLDPEYLPLVDPTTTSTQDILHLFPDGLTRSEFAWLMYILLKLKLSLARVNAAIRRYPGWPPDVRIPPLQAKLSQGTSGGKPRSAALPSMTGSQMMHFALHR